MFSSRNCLIFKYSILLRFICSTQGGIGCQFITW